MGHSDFIGKYKGKYTKTQVDSTGVTNTKAKASLEISEVGPGAYLVVVVDEDLTSYSHLGYMENNVIIAQAQSGEGVTSTYHADGKVIHQLSNKSSTTWIVKNYRFNKCKK